MKFRNDRERRLWERWSEKFLTARLAASRGTASATAFALDASERADALLLEWRERQ